MSLVFLLGDKIEWTVSGADGHPRGPLVDVYTVYLRSSTLPLEVAMSCGVAHICRLYLISPTG